MNLTPDVYQRAMEAGEKVGQGTYRYELEIELKEGHAKRIAFEAMRQKPKGQGKWQRVYRTRHRGTDQGPQDLQLYGLSAPSEDLRRQPHRAVVLREISASDRAIFVQDGGKAVFQIEPVHSFDGPRRNRLPEGPAQRRLAAKR